MRVDVVAIKNLPDSARVLLGGDFFSSAFWYEAVVQAALPPGTEAVCVVMEDAGQVAAVFPMQRHGARLAALTTPYTSLWQPLLAPGQDVAKIGAAFATLCRARPVRLDALDPAAPVWAGLIAGCRQARVKTIAFDHFGNWVCPQAGAGWDAYLATRPGQLREAIRRRTRKLTASGAVFRMIDGADGLAAGIDAYESMHAKSWKAPEPFPQFIATLMRACAAQGCLRLGVLSLNGQILAAQFWVVWHGTAMVMKLAHDSAADSWSPGTVLTAWVIRTLMTQDAVTSLDFGRGDDAYKQLWMPERRQRAGLMLAYPWRPAGAWEIARHRAGVLGRVVRVVEKAVLS